MTKLERSRGNRVIFGVCGGLARALGINADMVRVGWLLAVPAGGIGLALYAAAYFLVPESTEDTRKAGEDNAARNGGLFLVALAVLVYLLQTGFDALLPWGWSRTWGILVPLLLLGAGVLLIWPRARAAVGFSADRKLYRSVSDRVVAGVAGGIAREAGVDPNFVRLSFVLAAVLTWITLPLYVLLVLVLPEEEVPTREAVAPAAPPAPDGPSGADQGPEEPRR